jgi:hypothetical protein
MSTYRPCKVVVDVRVTEAVWTSPATSGFFETDELTMETGEEEMSLAANSEGDEAGSPVQAMRTSVTTRPMTCLDSCSLRVASSRMKWLFLLALKSPSQEDGGGDAP